MRYILSLSLLLCSLHSYCESQSFRNNSNALTWEPNGGRFGDNLLSYARTKWISYKYNIPLLYLPFPYSEKLLLHESENVYCVETAQQFKKTMRLPSKINNLTFKNNNTLYISNWITEVIIDWFDTTFVEELKKNITPINEIEKITIPENVISVAVHIRNGGTFAADTAQEKERCPLRFVPEEFFIEQVRRIAQMFPDRELYVFIFTDHPNPIKLVKKFQKDLTDERITFDCRTQGNSHKANVLEDFFSMMDFDCLIRPGSHFTRFVQRLGNNKLVIYPESIKEIAPGKKVIDTIKIKTRNDSTQRWKTKTIEIF